MRQKQPIDPDLRGRNAAELFRSHAPRLLADLIESDPWRASGTTDAERARREWDVFALYACVRGLVAGGGFNRETAQSLDAMHAALLDARADDSGETDTERRQRISARYEEYGAIGQAGGASGAATVATRLGAAAARHMLGNEPAPEVSELVGALHESLAEAVTAQVRGF